MSQTSAIIVIVGLSILGIVGDYFLKLAGHGYKYIDIKWFILGTLIFYFASIGWFLVMKHIKLSSLGLIYGCTTVIGLTIVGVLFFNERLNGFEVLGLISGLLSIILLARFS